MAQSRGPTSSQNTAMARSTDTVSPCLRSFLARKPASWLSMSILQMRCQCRLATRPTSFQGARVPYVARGNSDVKSATSTSQTSSPTLTYSPGSKHSIMFWIRARNFNGPGCCFRKSGDGRLYQSRQSVRCNFSETGSATEIVRTLLNEPFRNDALLHRRYESWHWHFDMLGQHCSPGGAGRQAPGQGKRLASCMERVPREGSLEHVASSRKARRPRGWRRVTGVPDWCADCSRNARRQHDALARQPCHQMQRGRCSFCGSWKESS